LAIPASFGRNGAPAAAQQKQGYAERLVEPEQSGDSYRRCWHQHEVRQQCKANKLDIA